MIRLTSALQETAGSERVVQTAESETPRPHQTSSDHICLDPGVLSPEASPCAVLWLCVSGEQGKSTRAEGKTKMENDEKYLPELLAEKDSLDSSFTHAMKLLNAGDVTARSEEEEEMKSCEGAGRHREEMEVQYLLNNESAHKSSLYFDPVLNTLSETMPLPSFLEIDRLQKDETKKEADDYMDLFTTKNIKLKERVLIPVKQYPKFNFVGKILGPQGNTIKRLQEETGAKISVLGKGSMRDKSKEEGLRKAGEPKYSHLSLELHVFIEVFAPVPEAYLRMAHAMEEVKKFLFPAEGALRSGAVDSPLVEHTGVGGCPLVELLPGEGYLEAAHPEGYDESYTDTAYESYDSYYSQPQAEPEYYDYGHGESTESYESYGQDDWNGTQRAPTGKAPPPSRGAKTPYREHPTEADAPTLTRRHDYRLSPTAALALSSPTKAQLSVTERPETDSLLNRSTLVIFTAFQRLVDSDDCPAPVSRLLTVESLLQEGKLNEASKSNARWSDSEKQNCRWHFSRGKLDNELLKNILRCFLMERAVLLGRKMTFELLQPLLKNGKENTTSYLPLNDFKVDDVL
ncbi:hypothetical protein F7725_024775 [Dissostichus mawsoni]|uniref:K Homology domain-containing protein n=1 Tax=Dissostichus mawsoni TaxID=36200 RepID=A0A7J5X9I0_DISMA|nr:hypothetical protein F7725_024775 [Dissostichus mawsoni]